MRTRPGDDGMRIVLLGRTGQVGRELERTLPAVGEVTAFDRAGADLERPDAVADLILGLRPDVVVNAAAYTAVDRAESEPDRARLVNATAVAALAAACRRVDALVVHYSTDYVFDGTQSGPHTETDSPAPLGVYGATKLAGERGLAAAGCRHLVFRTSWVYAAHGANFVRTILRLAGEREELAVVDDQTGAPTSAPLIAAITAAAVARAAGGHGLADGVYHLAPRGAVTWCGFARHVLEVARSLGMPLVLEPERVRPIPTAAYPTAARRPANSLLCTAKLEAAIGRTLPAWQDDAAPVLAALAAGRRD
jgi:dTDP-4-dehydrorhamnose reductase